MTRNSRNTLLATTMLAGLAIFTLDAARAGPNGGPSLGSISGFSSMRMDFNRVGGPGRALSRNDLRIIPLDVKATEKPKDTKKGTDVARVSNPKSASGGKGKEGVSNTPAIHVPAAVAAFIGISGGNPAEWQNIDKWAEGERLRTGPLVVNVPWGLGDGSYAFPEFWPGPVSQGKTPSSDDLLNWSTGTPGQPDTSKTRWAGVWIQTSTSQGDGWSVATYRNDETGATGTRRSTWNGDTSRREVVVEGRDSSGNTTRDRTVNETHTDSRGHVIKSRVSESTDIIDNGDGTTTTVTFRTYRTTDNGQEVYFFESTPTTTTDSEGNVIEETEKGSQPAGEFYGRGVSGWCSPIGGCYRPVRTNGLQVLPRDPDGSSTPEARRASPSWATDPNPDDLGGGSSNGGYHGHRPTDEEGGDIGGPGNPALAGLNAAL